MGKKIDMLILIAVVIASIFSIATTSIGMKCVKSSEGETSSNYKYLTYSIVMSIIVSVLSIVLFGIIYKYY
jgi:hypothetical protein